MQYYGIYSYFCYSTGILNHMRAFTKRDPFLIFLGDIVILLLSLWLTLLIRYQHIPGTERVFDHLVPFSNLFIAWLIVFYIAGLYEKRAFIFRQKLYSTIFRVQLVNSVIAVLFFYFIPYFGITPKTNLFIYLLVSFGLILVWRVYGYALLSSKERQRAILIARGKEMHELKEEVNSNENYGLVFVDAVDLDTVQDSQLKEQLLKKISEEKVSVAVVDFEDLKLEPLLPSLYSLMFSSVVFVDMHKIYEDVFNRIPLSLIKYSWFLEHVSLAPKMAYDVLKRIMDIIIALPLGIISLILYPIVFVLIKKEDKGPIIFTQERIGKSGKPIQIMKFRSMYADSNVDVTKDSSDRVMPVGNFLRKTRIDEIPQLWNVLKGDVSLIGPRPELPELIKVYEKEIPYYAIRHIIKPGLSGWAQIYHDNHPHHGSSVEQTKEKLSYDLYYLKNRSLWLDIKIALKTIKKLLSRSGI